MRESQKVAVKPKPQKIDKIALIVRPESPELANACKEVIAIFERFGVEVCALESSVQALGLDPRLACKEGDLGRRAQALVSLGGDGTLISAVRKSLGLGLPVLGINMGRLGFLTAIKPSELEEFVPLLKGGEYVLDSHHLLQGFLVDSQEDSALGSQGRVGFLAKNGDCGGEPAVITTQGNSLDSPCKAPFLAQKSCREQLQAKSAQSLESTFQQSPTAIPRILEKHKQAECEKSCREQTELESTFEKNAKLQNKDSSPNAPFSVIASRDSGVAIHKETTQILESTFEKVDSSPKAQSPQVDSSNDYSAPAESNQINGARKACNLESVQGDWGAKGVKKEGGIRGDASQVAPLSPLEKNSSKVSLKSSNNAQKVESSMDSKETSAQPKRYPLFSKEATLCHADFQSARNDKKLDSSENIFYVLNEILITKKDISGMTKIYATINNEHFHTYRADGLIIATPTGSSAYNISAGGSLVHPQCRVILLTPVCAHSLTQRPIIISDNFCLQFSVEEDSVIMLDGQERIDFRKGDTLFVQGSFPIQLIQHPKRSYFAVLEEKFGLGGKQV